MLCHDARTWYAGRPLCPSEAGQHACATHQGLYGQVQNRVTILHEMTTTFYGTREFTIQDCNGYVLTFAQAETEAS